MTTRSIAAAAALLAFVTACSSVPTMPSEVNGGTPGYPVMNGSEGDSGLGIGSGRQFDETGIGAAGSESDVDGVASDSRDGGLGIGTG